MDRDRKERFEFIKIKNTLERRCLSYINFVLISRLGCDYSLQNFIFFGILQFNEFSYIQIVFNNLNQRYKIFLIFSPLGILALYLPSLFNVVVIVHIVVKVTWFIITNTVVQFYLVECFQEFKNNAIRPSKAFLNVVFATTASFTWRSSIVLQAKRKYDK